MVLTPVFAFGPDFGDDRWFVDDDTAAPSGFSLDASTDVSAHASSGEECFRWLKLDGAGNGNGGLIKTATVTLGTYVWAVIRAGVLETTGTPSDGDRRRIFRIGHAGTQFDVFMEWDDADTWHYEIDAVGGGTVGEFTTTTEKNDIAPAIRVEWNGISIRGWIEGNDQPEFSNPETGKPTNRGWNAFANSLISGEKAYFAGLYLGTSSDEDDRPDYEIKHWYFTIGSMESTAEYGDNTDCETSDGLGEDLQLDGNRDTDESIYICDIGGDVGSIIVDTSTADGTITGTGIAMTAYTISRASLSQKTVNSTVRIEEGGDSSEVGLTVLGVSFRSRQTFFPNAADGTPWNNAHAVATEAGIRGNSGNGANDEHAALALFFTSIGNDPPKSRALVSMF